MNKNFNRKPQSVVQWEVDNGSHQDENQFPLGIMLKSREPAGNICNKVLAAPWLHIEIHCNEQLGSDDF